MPSPSGRFPFGGCFRLYTQLSACPWGQGQCLSTLAPGTTTPIAAKNDKQGPGWGRQGLAESPRARARAMLDSAKRVAAFLQAPPCKDLLALLLAWAVVWLQWSLKHLTESYVRVRKYLLALRVSRSCSAPCSSFTRSLIVPCPNQEATSTYEKSLPSYEQIQGQVVGSGPLPPTAQPRPRSCSQLAVQAKAEVHRELGGAGDHPQEPAPRLETAAGSWYVRPVGSGWHRWDAG